MDQVSPPPKAEVILTARKLIAKYSWQAVQLDPLVEWVSARIAAGATLAGRFDLERLCMRAAAVQLYAHCERGALVSATPSEQQHQLYAYQDLGNYLLLISRSIGFQPAPDAAWEDVIQETLIAIAKSFSGSKLLFDDPGATMPGAAGARRKSQSAQTNTREAEKFLGLAVVILNRQRIAAFRAWQRRNSISLDAQDENGFAIVDVLTAPETEESGDPGKRENLGGERVILSVVGDCLKTDEQRIVILSIYFALKRNEIMQVFRSLKTRYDNVRRTALQLLRDCELFHEYANWLPPLPAS